MLYVGHQEMLKMLGANLRGNRLAMNISQQTAADRSGISLKAVRNLEEGKNSSTLSLLQYCRTLGKIDWLLSIAPPEITDDLFDRPVPKKRLRAMPKRKPQDD